jgi:MFS transporter, FSR family, fosmidomycin resistance protein
MVIACGHGVDDLYQGAVPVLIPTLVTIYDWNYTMAGSITLAATVLSSVAQPLFGLLADRRPAPWAVPVGMFTAGAGIAAIGLVHSYVLVCCAVGLSGLGVAAYHPESARLARLNAGGSHTVMSWYSLSGNLGFAAAPLVVSPLIAVAGLDGTPWLVIPVVVMAAITMGFVPATRQLRFQHNARRQTGVVRQNDWKNFTKLITVVVMRSIATYGIATFLVLLVRSHTDSSAIGQAALTLFYTAGAAGTLAGGWLAQRGWRRTQLLVSSYLMAIPTILLIVVTPSWLSLAGAALAGFSLFIPFSLHVTLGQDYLPNRVGTASGVTLGLAVSAGGFAAPGLGILADHTSVSTAVGTLAVCALLALIAAATLHEPEPIYTSPPNAEHRHPDRRDSDTITQ